MAPPVSNLLSPRLGLPEREFSFLQTAVDEARLACALERYRLAHGEFPDKLDALAPRFINKLPHDLTTGRPFKYRRTADGQFLLYSVGWNAVDDGGVPSPLRNDWRGRTLRVPDLDSGDWVWAYPAKP